MAAALERGGETQRYAFECFVFALLAVTAGGCGTDYALDDVDELVASARMVPSLDAGQVAHALEQAACDLGDGGSDFDGLSLVQGAAAGLFENNDCMPRGGPVHIEPKAPEKPEQCPVVGHQITCQVDRSGDDSLSRAPRAFDAASTR